MAVMNARKQRGYHSDKLNECRYVTPRSLAYATRKINRRRRVLPTEVARFARQAAGRQDDSEAEVGEKDQALFTVRRGQMAHSIE